MRARQPGALRTPRGYQRPAVRRPARAVTTRRRRRSVAPHMTPRAKFGSTGPERRRDMDRRLSKRGQKAARRDIGKAADQVSADDLRNDGVKTRRTGHQRDREKEEFVDPEVGEIATQSADPEVGPPVGIPLERVDEPARRADEVAITGMERCAQHRPPAVGVIHAESPARPTSPGCFSRKLVRITSVSSRHAK